MQYDDYKKPKYKKNVDFNVEDEDSFENGKGKHNNQESDVEIQQDLKGYQGPIQLVKVSDDLKKFEVNQEALTILRKIEGDIGVVSVAGSQRTGKSFILNLLLDKFSGSGFKISPSTKSCTQGIWLWGQPIYVKNRNMYILLLDTEGSGSLQKNQNHDAKIFALVVLITSFFIFNSMQTIDETSIASLSLAAELSNFIKVRAKEGEQSGDNQLSQMTPRFLWLLRDFALELRENGREITENEYLEDRLSNFSKSTNERNKKVREALMKYFQQRELLTMVRPVEDEFNLNKLDKLAFSEFREEFRQKASILKHKVFNETPAKQINNKCINGVYLSYLIEQFVDSLNKGATPNISSAWDNVIERENQRCYEMAIKQIDNQFKRITFPQEKPDLLMTIDKIKNDALDLLERQTGMIDNKIDRQDLEVKKQQILKLIDEKMADVQKRNYGASIMAVNKTDKIAFNHIEDTLSSTSYQDTNIAKMQSDFSKYFKQLKKGTTEGGGGPASMAVLKDLLMEKVKQINQNLKDNLEKKVKEGHSMNKVDFEKLTERKNFLQDEIQSFHREETVQMERISMLQQSLEQSDKFLTVKKVKVERLEDERKKLDELQLEKIEIQVKDAAKTNQKILEEKKKEEEEADRIQKGIKDPKAPKSIAKKNTSSSATKEEKKTAAVSKQNTSNKGSSKNNANGNKQNGERNSASGKRVGILKNTNKFI